MMSFCTVVFFFFKQKTAYEMRISDWSSDVCSSDLQLLIRRGLKALARALALGGADGPYALQAALAACHARARTAEATDWRRIAGLYDRLGQVMPSPVVELNRAVAHSMALRPAALGSAACRARVCPYVEIYVVAVSLKTKKKQRQK